MPLMSSISRLLKSGTSPDDSAIEAEITLPAQKPEPRSSLTRPAVPQTMFATASGFGRIGEGRGAAGLIEACS